MRRSRNSVVSVLRCRDVQLDPARRVVTRAGAEVVLSASEYRTLLALMERAGQTVSREQLEAAVYGGSGTIEGNTVAVYVHQLRRKLGDDLVATVHGPVSYTHLPCRPSASCARPPACRSRWARIPCP